MGMISCRMGKREDIVGAEILYCILRIVQGYVGRWKDVDGMVLARLQGGPLHAPDGLALGWG